jgi:hypothetical protein
MDPLDVWWAVAGGWAIDLWLGEQSREHHDVEIVIRQQDQRIVGQFLRTEWQLLCLDPPGASWIEWGVEPILPPSFQLKVRAASREFDIFLESTAGDLWVFRRDERLRRPVGEVTLSTGSGIPVVRPEVQLLYMAKSSEPKHQHDFSVARPRLPDEAASWLREALQLTHAGHRWLDQL